MVRWIASVLLMAALIVAAGLLVAQENPVYTFWEPVAFGLVGIGTLIYLLAAFGRDELRRAVSLAWSRRPAADEEWITADHLFESAMRAVLAFGAIGYVIGLMSILKSLDDPKKLGPSIAVALLSVFWAVVFGELVFGTLRMRTQRYLRSKQIGSGGSAPGAGSYVAGVILLMIPLFTCFLVM